MGPPGPRVNENLQVGMSGVFKVRVGFEVRLRHGFCDVKPSGKREPGLPVCKLRSNH